MSGWGSGGWGPTSGCMDDSKANELRKHEEKRRAALSDEQCRKEDREREKPKKERKEQSCNDMSRW